MLLQSVGDWRANREWILTKQLLGALEKVFIFIFQYSANAKIPVPYLNVACLLSKADYRILNLTRTQFYTMVKTLTGRFACLCSYHCWSFLSESTCFAFWILTIKAFGENSLFCYLQVYHACSCKSPYWRHSSFVSLLNHPSSQSSIYSVISLLIHPSIQSFIYSLTQKLYFCILSIHLTISSPVH